MGDQVDHLKPPNARKPPLFGLIQSFSRVMLLILHYLAVCTFILTLAPGSLPGSSVHCPIEFEVNIFLRVTNGSVCLK